MKKSLYIVFLLILGCSEFEVPSTVTVHVSANYPDKIKDGKVITNEEVLLQNIQTGREYKSTTNEKGIATFEVRGGIYNIVASFTKNVEIFSEENSQFKEVLFSARIANQHILENNLQLELKTDFTILNSGFIFKEIYTSGSRTPEGATYAPDKFIEIYNNSEAVLYSDGLCFGVVHPTITSRPSPFTDSEGNLLDRIPCWSFIAIIPGAGKDHPVQPGESILLALSGINHRDDPNGNPNSIDLSNADWEFYVEDGKYVDSPAVPNLVMTRIFKGTAISLSTRGQVCVLFRLPSDDWSNIFSNVNNYMIEPGGSEKCFMVPKQWIIDGVENAWMDDSKVYKRLLPSIDIGYIQHRGSYQKVSIKRKIKEVINGRTIYQDTNNSTNDFLTNQEPTPGIIATN